MRAFLILILFMSLFSESRTLLAQPSERCGTVPYMKVLEQQDPSLSARINENEDMLTEYMQRVIRTNTTTIREIPLVIHVIWNKPYQNLCEELIRSQVQVLNEDFGRKNADSSDTPDVFKSLGEDSGIRFVLANRDTNGNLTNGIIRSYTEREKFVFGAEMKFEASDGQNAWDPDRYLNIWVCNLEGSVLGYATLPGTANPGEDGVVITTKAFGRNSYDPQGKYNLGRTTTHEVGHWLDLYHTWGDDDGACNGSDFVDDTPNQSNYTFGCPDFPHKSCGNGPDGDMFMNYMDYTDDRCMNIFTKGQNLRMQGALDLLRPSILTSNGYVPDSNVTPISRIGNIIVAPNPFSGEFVIYVKLKKISDLKIDVFDHTGKLVYREKFPDCFCQTFHVNMQAFRTGLYTARIESNEETIATKLILFR